MPKPTLTQEAKQHKSFSFGMPPAEEVEYALWQASCCISLAGTVLEAACSPLFASAVAKAAMHAASAALIQAENAISAAERAFFVALAPPRAAELPNTEAEERWRAASAKARTVPTVPWNDPNEDSTPDSVE